MQTLIDALVDGFAVPPVDVHVLAVRPSDIDGELHGLYEPDEELPHRAHHASGCAPRRRSRWSRSGRSCGRVVHEFLHHLDYEHFKLPETFHTEGFYRRESSLANALLGRGRRARTTSPVPAQVRRRR